MRALRVILLIVILVAFGAGCDDNRFARFTNVEGLASIRSGMLLRVWGYAKECKEEEKPEPLRKFPFVYELFDSESFQGPKVFAVSNRKLLTREKIVVCGKWTKTGSISYLRVRLEKPGPKKNQVRKATWLKSMSCVRSFPPRGACNSPLFHLPKIIFFAKISIVSKWG